MIDISEPIKRLIENQLKIACGRYIRINSKPIENRLKIACGRYINQNQLQIVWKSAKIAHQSESIQNQLKIN